MRVPGGFRASRYHKRDWGCVALLLASCVLHAQTPTDAGTVRIRNTVRLVEVDVIAKDKHGNPVKDLEAKDFTLLDNGKVQKITRVTVEQGTPDNRGDSARSCQYKRAESRGHIF